ncbi:hypothetical protein HID58_059847, partial [Brassica napus]
ILIEKYGSRFLEITYHYREVERCAGIFVFKGHQLVDLRKLWVVTAWIVTAQVIMNYAFLLEENNYFEDALNVEDKAGAGESFFEYDVSMGQSDANMTLYLQYAKLEEDYGLAKRAMKVYGKATKKVPEGQVSHVILPLFPLFLAHKQLFVLNFENPFVEEKEELNKAGFPEDKMASLERQLMAPMSATVTPKDGGRQLGKREEDGKKAEEGGENGAAKALGAL